MTGDMVAVEANGGMDIGRISLSGELVRLQLKKKKTNVSKITRNILRRANQRDMDRLMEARGREKETLIKARAIARTMDMDMKIGDVEFQGDMRKVTIYYTADGRVDFRELIRHYAKEFRTKIEMRQIGARQESARIGGIGSCGRELCCSTWLSDFKSVSTAAARYQNLAINQSKLSGQCGRLKCCLNYELDTYMEALEKFPKNVDKLKTKTGTAHLIKTDIFKGLMFYNVPIEKGRNKIITLPVARVHEVKAMNEAGEFPAELMPSELLMAGLEPEAPDYEDVTGAIELPMEKRRRKKRRKKKKPTGTNNTGKQQKANTSRSGSESKTKNKPNTKSESRPPQNKKKPATKSTANNGKAEQKPANPKEGGTKPKRRNNRRRGRGRKPQDGNKNGNNNNNNKGGGDSGKS